MGEPVRSKGAEEAPPPQGLTRDGRNLAAEVKAHPEYKKLVEKCAPRWNKPYKKLPIDKQDMAIKSDEDFQQVLASSARKMGGALGEYLLIKPDKKAKAEPSWELRNLTNLKKFDKASYEACRVRCDDLDFIELNLRVQYGDEEFERLFPNRYISHHGSTAAGPENHKRTQYCIRRRTIENRWNLTNKRARMPLLYIEDWTDGDEDDKTLSLLEFINYLVKTEYLEGVLVQFNKLGATLCHEGYGCAGKTCPAQQCTCTTANGANALRAYGTDVDADLKYECISECECDEDVCENRKVQRGRQIPLCVFREPGKDWGVRAICEIAPKTFVTEYCGEASETGRTGDKARYDFSMRYPMRKYGADKNLMDEFVVSAGDKGNESRYFNHSCDPNMESACVVIERYGVFFHHIAFFTGNETIPAGAELTFDYFPDKLKGDRSTKHMFNPCKCGTAKCRFLKRSKANGISCADKLMEERLRMESKIKVSRMASLFGFMTVRDISEYPEHRVMPRVFRRDFTSSAEEDVTEEDSDEDDSDESEEYEMKSTKLPRCVPKEDMYYKAVRKGTIMKQSDEESEEAKPPLKAAKFPRKTLATKYYKGGGVWKPSDSRETPYKSTGGKAARKTAPTRPSPTSSEEESEDYSSDDEPPVQYGVKSSAMRKSTGGKTPRRVPPTGVVAPPPKQMATKAVRHEERRGPTYAVKSAWTGGQIPIFPKCFTEASGGVKRVRKSVPHMGTYDDYTDDETETDEESTEESEEEIRYQLAHKAARKSAPMAYKAARKTAPVLSTGGKATRRPAPK